MQTSGGTPASKALREAREAVGHKAWAEAFALYTAADQDAPLEVDDVERLATAAYLIGHDETSSDLWTRAHHEHVRAKDFAGGARCGFWLTLDLFNRGEWARGNGWLGRSLRLLDDNDIECAERGLLLALAARSHMKYGETDAATAAVGKAAAIAREFADPELAVFSRLSDALARLRRGEFSETAALLDEVMVGVTVDDVSPIGVGVIYCAVIDACYHLFDLGRAREWTAALGRWCNVQKDLVAFRGKCLVHRAEIMRFGGAWPEAMAEAEQACRWSDGRPPSFKYPLGAAYYELAEIHRLRGDYAAAETAYRRASEYGRSPEPGLALLRFGQGDITAAVTTIRRQLGEQQEGLPRATVLSAAVDILLAAGDLVNGRSAAGELTQMAQVHAVPLLRALAAQAMGAVHVAGGAAHEALPALREAWTTWQDLNAPYQAACVRVLLAAAYQQLGDTASADLEFDTAHRVFQRLSALPDMARIDRLRATQQDTGHGLTARELQVLGLVAQGKTNRAIARQLSISERTVDRHVSNILLKLELPSRSAATAYAFQHGLA